MSSFQTVQRKLLKKYIGRVKYIYINFSVKQSYNVSFVAVDIRPESKYYKSNQLKIDVWPFGEYGIATKFYINPTYGPSWTPEPDIAIIEFPEGTHFGVDPIPLAKDYEEKEGDWGIAAGYGYYKVTCKSPISGFKS